MGRSKIKWKGPARRTLRVLSCASPSLRHAKCTPGPLDIDRVLGECEVEVVEFPATLLAIPEPVLKPELEALNNLSRWLVVVPAVRASEKRGDRHSCHRDHLLFEFSIEYFFVKTRGDSIFPLYFPV